MIKPRALVLSLIPVRKRGEIFEADNRWAQDINMQAEGDSVTLLCPVGDHLAPNFGTLRPEIEIAQLGESDIRQLVEAADFVQVPGNSGWRRRALVLEVARLAKKSHKPVFLGISSDRAKTAWINRRRSPLGTAKAALQWLDVRVGQWLLARQAAGVFVVGQGIAHLARPNANIHVGTASWISAKDEIKCRAARIGPARIACASRLEPMKGVQLGVEAVARLRRAHEAICFDVVGEGPELAHLQYAVKAAGLQPITRFLGQLSYPEEFLSYLGSVDVVLLTNLNDEQPRLIFDAISQGCLPVCPRSQAYLALGLDERLLYQRGRADAAAAVISELLAMSQNGREEIARGLRALAAECTIETMHQRRAEWIARTRAGFTQP